MVGSYTSYRTASFSSNDTDDSVQASHSRKRLHNLNLQRKTPPRSGDPNFKKPASERPLLNATRKNGAADRSGSRKSARPKPQPSSPPPPTSHPLDLDDSQTMSQTEKETMLSDLARFSGWDEDSQKAIKYLLEVQCPNKAQIDAQYEELSKIGKYAASWRLCDKVPLLMGNPQKSKGKARMLNASLTDLGLTPAEMSDKISERNLAEVLKVDASKLNILRLLDLLLLAFIEQKFSDWDKVENLTRTHPTNQQTGRLAWAQNYGGRLSTRIYNNDQRESDRLFQTDRAKRDYMQYAECFRLSIELLHKSPYMRSLDLTTALKTKEKRNTLFAEFNSCFHEAVEPIHVLFKAMTISFSGFIPSEICQQIGKSVGEHYKGGKMKAFFYNHVLNGPAQYHGTDKLTWNLLWDGATYIFRKNYRQEVAEIASAAAEAARTNTPPPQHPPPQTPSGSGQS